MKQLETIKHNMESGLVKKEVIQSFLITSARYKFSIYEKRILSLLIADMQRLLEGKHLHGKLERNLFNTSYCEFSTAYLRGDDKSNGKLYQEALKGLATKGIEYQTANGEWEFCNLIAFPKVTKGVVSFTLSNDIIDLFLNFSKGYSKYVLSISLSLKSTASSRMYELISNQKGVMRFKIDTLKQMLGAEHYTLTGNFIQRVLKPAQKELYEVANWSFEFMPIRGANGKFISIQITPIHIPRNEPEEVTKANAIRQVHLSWYIDTDVTLKLMDLGMTKQGIKDNMETIQKFAYKYAHHTIEKIGEIWVRASRLKKYNPIGYLIKAMKEEVVDI